MSERDAKLLATLVRVLLASVADSARLSRGRSYARMGAVDQLHVTPGAIIATVQGSRARPYDVTIGVTSAPAATGRGLVPDAREVYFDCSCPDWDDPCKHAIAVMTAFADAVELDADVLSTWRGATVSQRARARVGSRATTRRTSSPARSVATAELDPTARAALEVFLDAPPSTFELPRVSTLTHHAADWDDPWSIMLADALRALAES